MSTNQHRKTPAARDAQSRAPKPASAGVFRIVLVDDHPMVRERLAEVINAARDLSVCGEAEDARDAFAVIEKTKPHLAIVDLSLKTTFGLDLIHELRARHPKVALLVLTMYESPLYAERALRAGALGYLTKRDATTKILEAVRSVLDGQPYLSEALAPRVAAALAIHGRSEDEPALARLSDRELQVLRMLGDGRKTRQIADALHVDVRTVETYRGRIKEKLDLKDGLDLLRYAIEWKGRGEAI